MSNINDLVTYLELRMQEVEGSFKSHSRDWLIAFALAVILLAVLLITVFRKTSGSDETLTMLKQQQAVLDSLSKQQKAIAAQDRARDSVFYVTYMKNTAQRESDLSKQKSHSNEIVNRITKPGFNADSIKSWWSNN